MVGSESTSSRSFSLSVAAPPADAGPAASGILRGSGVLVAPSGLVPRRNGWTSRVGRTGRSRACARDHFHPGLNHPISVGDNNNNSSSTDSLDGSGRRPASDSDSSPVPTSAQPTVTAAATSRSPSSVPVWGITCGAVGGIIALAVVFALVYIRRVRRRVKSMKRRTNVLGPELAPISPSQLSKLSAIESPCVNIDFDGSRLSRMTSELKNHLPPLIIPSISSSTSLELPGIVPLSPIRTSTIILSPPPAARRSTLRSSIPSPHSNPRSPIYSPRAAAVPWPLITALSLSNDHPQHELRIMEHNKL